MQRRQFLTALAAAPFVAHAAPPAKPVIEVWKSSTCGCCKEWMRHMEINGFEVRAYDTGNASKRSKLGIARDYGSCHTALVNGYAIEGHVPAREIKRLLAQRPDAIGLAVPGMPMGSPGMEQGGRIDPYTVLLLRRDGGASAYANYGL